MHLYLQEHSDDGDHIVSEHVIPLLSSMPDGQTRQDLIVAIAPALYKNQRTTKSIYFDSLNTPQLGSALMACAIFILERHIPSDPYEKDDKGYSISYPDAINVVDLASNIKQDNLVYILVVALSDTLSSHSIGIPSLT